MNVEAGIRTLLFNAHTQKMLIFRMYVSCSNETYLWIVLAEGIEVIKNGPLGIEAFTDPLCPVMLVLLRGSRPDFGLCHPHSHIITYNTNGFCSNDFIHNLPAL
jgi:hypothetical protein